MNSFDTLKFSIPLGKCELKKKSNFNIQSTFSNEVHLVERKLVLNKFYPGVKNVTINQLKERVVFELSAKILLQNYFKGLNILNIKSVCDLIRSYGICYLFHRNLLQFSTVFRADVTNNIPIKNKIENYILALNLSNQNTNLYETTYKNESIVFVENPLSRRRRLRCIFYDKVKELRTEKITEIKQTAFDFEGTLRMETTLNNFDLIRKSINAEVQGDVNLELLLNSKNNINQDLFQKLFMKKNDTSEKKDLLESSLKFYQVEKELGRYSLCSNFDFDYTKIKNYIRSRVKGNLSNYFRNYKRVCRLKKPELLIKTSENLINELFNNLKKAA